jgi:flagellar motor protein MotB
MRAQARRSSREEEEESAFISMTDMTVGFLFIVMILLAFFASKFSNDMKGETVPKAVYEAEVSAREKIEAERDALMLQLAELQAKLDAQLLVNAQQAEEIARLEAEIERLMQEIALLEKRIAELLETRRDPLEVYLSQVSEARRKLLQQLKQQLEIDFPDLKIELSEQSDALRFQGDGLFVKGRSSFNSAAKAEIVRTVARRLNEVLPCYTFQETPIEGPNCDNPHAAIIEAVQVEGHTDADGSYATNTVLSAERATRTFSLMIETVPELRSYRNFKEQPVMSFAGYGPDRPIKPNDTSENMATNRRIDLRFIMVTPAKTEEIENIRARFGDLGGPTP